MINPGKNPNRLYVFEMRMASGKKYRIITSDSARWETINNFKKIDWMQIKIAVKNDKIWDEIETISVNTKLIESVKFKCEIE